MGTNTTFTEAPDPWTHSTVLTSKARPRHANDSSATPQGRLRGVPAAVRRGPEEGGGKYAWTAQHQGVVLRRNPLKQPPYRDYIYNRIAKADYGFHYLDERGKKRFWYPQFEEVFGLTLEGELDLGILVAERIEFLPGKEEITHDSDECRVLNLWRPPPWKDEGGREPDPFLRHLDYLFGRDAGAVNHVLDYLAHLIQRPDERIGHALLITSEAKGIGKSTFGKSCAASSASRTVVSHRPRTSRASSTAGSRASS